MFYLTDGLGSTRERVTSSADVVDGYHYTYDVWGGLRSAQPAAMNDFRFIHFRWSGPSAGEQTDVRANRGLVYLRVDIPASAAHGGLPQQQLIRCDGGED